METLKVTPLRRYLAPQVEKETCGLGIFSLLFEHDETDLVIFGS